MPVRIKFGSKLLALSVLLALGARELLAQAQIISLAAAAPSILSRHDSVRWGPDHRRGSRQRRQQLPDSGRDPDRVEPESGPDQYPESGGLFLASRAGHGGRLDPDSLQPDPRDG